MSMERQIALSVVCDMNNGAVDLLAAGFFDLAQFVFVEAVQATMKLIMEEREKHKIDRAPNSFGTVETSSSSDFLFQSSILNSCHGKSRSNVGCDHLASSEDRVFVYQRAFKLRYDHYIPPFETMCIILLYNMGIGFHIRGTPTCSHDALKQAASYYVLALSACDGGTESTQVIPPTLRLAILNNLGEIYFRLSQFEDMMIVYDFIKDSWCDAQVAVLVGGPFLNQAEKHGLQWNTNFYRKPEMTAAAA